MGSKIDNKISINIPNYNGPLEVLLDLAKLKKSIWQKFLSQNLDQFLEFIKNQENLNLETATEFL